VDGAAVVVGVGTADAEAEGAADGEEAAVDVEAPQAVRAASRPTAINAGQSKPFRLTGRTLLVR